MKNEIFLPQLSLEDFCYDYSNISNGAVAQNEKSYITFKAPGFFYSRNFLRSPDEKNIPVIADEIKAGFDAGGTSVTTFTKELSAGSTSDIFKEKGFKTLLIQYGMVFDLNEPFESYDDKDIKRIEKDDLPAWLDTMYAGFGAEKLREDKPYEIMIENPNIYFLAFFKGDKIAGTTMLHAKKFNAGIHEVAVPEEYRGAGISKKLVLQALKISKDAGMSVVSLQASDLGKPVYSKIGFKEVSEIHTLYIDA